MRLRAYVISFVFLLSGCASIPSRPPVVDKQVAWNERQAALAVLQAWELRGRVAVRTADDGGQASLHWVHQPQMHRVDLAGPFGGGRVRLTQDAQGAMLRDSSGKIYRDDSMQQLLLRATGWWLPLDELTYWVRGLPAPSAVAHAELDDWGRLRRLEQSGWEIQFTAYITEAGHELPSQMVIRRGAAPAEPTLVVRLVVERWNLTNAIAP